jgi:hypothetical protein
MPESPIDILKRIAATKHVTPKWIGQPLYEIKILANTSKGDLAEDFVEEYSNALGFTAAKNPTRQGDYDVKINNKKFEVKMATEDISGNFQFNHIRYDYHYDWLLCIGVSPNELRFAIYDKGGLASDKYGTMVSMGRGQNSSFKLTKSKESLRPISEYKTALTGLLS